MTTPGAAGSGNIADQFVEWLRSLGSDSSLARDVYQNPEEKLAEHGFNNETLYDCDYQSLNQGLNFQPVGAPAPAHPPYNFPPPPPGTPPADHVAHEVKNYVTHVYEGDEYVIDDRDYAVQVQGDVHGDLDATQIFAEDGAIVNEDSTITDSNLNSGDNVAQAGGNQENVTAGEGNKVANVDIEQNAGDGGTAGAGGAGGTATSGDADGGDGGYGTGGDGGYGGAGGPGGPGGAGGDAGYDPYYAGSDGGPGGDGGYGGAGGAGGYGGDGTGGYGGDGGTTGDASADGGYGGSADGGDNSGDINLDIDFGDEAEEPAAAL
jgi:hypothetical protein